LLVKTSTFLEEMRRVFVDNRLKTGRFMKNHPPPFIARVSASGVAMVYPKPRR